MMEQMTIGDELMWEAGYDPACVVTGRGTCRFVPCTFAQGVTCCRDCPTGCSGKCRRVTACRYSQHGEVRTAS